MPSMLPASPPGSSSADSAASAPVASHRPYLLPATDSPRTLPPTTIYHPLPVNPLPVTPASAGVWCGQGLLWPSGLLRDLHPALHLPLASKMRCLPFSFPPSWDEPLRTSTDLSPSVLPFPSPRTHEGIKADLEEQDIHLGATRLLEGDGEGRGEGKADEGKLRELEQFAANFKSRRIKLGFTQTNVGE